ncbi:MAG: DEAD/DEAH box helicase family protein [Bacteroidetes bacterium]|nr:DEAD/DEAH box helicase family protein [Bacteroidota bacterium]
MPEIYSSLENPILNNPYEEPTRYYQTLEDGTLNYSRIMKGRRPFTDQIASVPLANKAPGMFDISESGIDYNKDINLIRNEIRKWREEQYPGTTRVTKTLLEFWFLNPDRLNEQKHFFAQREAIETAIWLNEIAEKSNVGSNILRKLKEAEVQGLPRAAFKMATGTGKTVVMASLILYHYFNRQEYRSDNRFADNFLLVAPGITIKDRLNVLIVDTQNDISQDYYYQRRLVPRSLEEQLKGLNSKLVITNYHSFEPKTLQGNKRSPFDGKLDAEGNKMEAKESFNSVVKRLLGKFKTDTRLLIINDEAHHCYMPREKGKNTEEENSKDENERAAVWFSGLVEISKRFKVRSVYDLSATPYYLNGSGYEAGALFPWVVSDFGLIEAIESGLVKIPFLPEFDNTQDLSAPKLRELYAHVKEELSKKGQRTSKKEAKQEGKKIKESPPQLPALVKNALDQFYTNYKRDFDRIGDLFHSPPVFIVVCNNTTVSKEVYKHIAGYEYEDENGNLVTVPGHLDLFNNYDKATGRLVARPPSLLIDSDALENSNQIDDSFKKIFSTEIETFKREYARIHGSGSADQITDAEILREVVNTVGKKGSLGSHIRCVVSVSMLTEGWDANTVTHIMGLRAFGSQLLCEQVAGRALRRKNYILNAKTNTFDPEYAQIIGVPFKLFKSGKETDPPPAPDYKKVDAMPERQKKYEIPFPQVLGYKEEILEDIIRADFSTLENFELDGSRLPTETVMFTAFSETRDRLSLDQVRSLRRQQIIYAITKDLLFYKFKEEDGYTRYDKFNQIKSIVEEWYDTKIHCIGDTFPQMIMYADSRQVSEHIYRGIIKGTKTSRKILPVLNHYNPIGSTKYVHGLTAKPVYETSKCHVNYVVADSVNKAEDANLWEHIAAKTLEEMKEVEAYVKNNFLGFYIPYTNMGKDKQYFPDFIARCKTPSGKAINLIIEITGANRKDKSLKKDFVTDLWLPAVNNIREKYDMPEWHYIEIANDIRDIKNQLLAKLKETNPEKNATK